MNGPCNDSALDMHPASAQDYIPTLRMRNLQLVRLRATVRRAYQHVDLYRRSRYRLIPVALIAMISLLRFSTPNSTSAAISTARGAIW